MYSDCDSPTAAKYTYYDPTFRPQKTKVLGFRIYLCNERILCMACFDFRVMDENGMPLSLSCDFVLIGDDIYLKRKLY